MNTKYEERMGTDPITPLIFRMAMPSVIAQLVNLLYNIVDRMYIGHIPEIGTNALAGVGVTSSIIILVSAFSSIVGGGGVALAAIALGKNDRERAGKILGNGFVLLIIFSVFTAAISYIFMTPLLRVIGASNNTIGYAVSYLRVYLVGTLFVQMATGLNTFINAQGRPGIAMWSVIAGAIINIVLDPVFIYVFKRGVAGAAVASVISQGASCAWVLCYLFSKKASLPLEKRYMKLEGDIVKSTFELGVSPFIMGSTESLVGFVLNGTLAKYGDIYVSALTVMQSALQLVSVPLSGFAQGTVPVLSYNYGHRNPDRLKKGYRVLLRVEFYFSFIAIGLMMIFPRGICRMFTTDGHLMDTVARFLPIFFAGMTIFGMQRACQNTFVALGQAKISLFIALLRKVILLVPLALLFSNFFGVTGVYAAEAVADATAATICMTIFMFKFPKILRSNQ